MTLSHELLKIIILLVPGIISMLLLERLITNNKLEFKRFVLNIIVLSIFSYLLAYLLWEVLFLLYSTLRWASPIISSPVDLSEYFTSTEFKINFWIVLYTSFCGVLLAMVMAIVINVKIVTKIGRWLHITVKHGDETVWDYFHNKPKNDWVVVRDIKHDIMYFGWIEAFSDDGTEYDELILKDVSVYNNTNANKLYDANEIYLSGKREDLRIEIHNYNKD